MKKFVGWFLCSFAITISSYAEQPKAPYLSRIQHIYSAQNRNLMLMRIEAAIAQAQAEHGVIAKSAAKEIAAKAKLEYAPLEDVAKEYARVNHRMVALLNVWKRSLSTDTANALHFGITTVDVFDTLRVLQIRDTIDALIDAMRAIETELMRVANEHRNTIMIGRTRGQHALPLTFGKKMVVWAAQNRRNIERLKELRQRIANMGVLKGAVGTHLGLGDKGVVLEKRVARLLDLHNPDPADWHGARDNFAEFGLLLGLIAKSYASFGDEVFRMQMTDIAEVEEKLSASAVGSSTMPHKRNPRKSEDLIHHGRTLPRLAEVLLDDVQNDFERDNTSKAGHIIEELSLAADDMNADMLLLLKRLVVHPERMRENLDSTGGLVMAQRIVLFLSESIGRDDAEERVRQAVQQSLESGDSFRSTLMGDEVLASQLSDHLDTLFDPTTYIGLSAEQVGRTIEEINKQRKTD